MVMVRAKVLPRHRVPFGRPPPGGLSRSLITWGGGDAGGTPVSGLLVALLPYRYVVKVTRRDLLEVDTHREDRAEFERTTALTGG